MDWTDCPIVEVNPRVQGGTSVVRGTRAPVSAILINHDSGSSDAEIAENFGLTTSDVRKVLAFAPKVRDSKMLVP